MKPKTIYRYICIFIILVICLLVYMHYNSTNKKMVKNLASLGNKTFMASSKYADVEYKTSNDAKTLYITVKYKDLTGVSAAHIHVNNNGSPGQILAWLGTTPQWQQGVLQNTPGKNAPCCFNKKNPFCTLAAPSDTPDINELSNTVMNFTVTNNSCNSGCPWIENGTLLDFHGFNFQQIINCKLTNEKPGLDLISNTAFTEVKNE